MNIMTLRCACFVTSLIKFILNPLLPAYWNPHYAEA